MREENYQRYAKEHDDSVVDVERVAEDDSFYDGSGHAAWLDSVGYAEFASWLVTAMAEDVRHAAEF